MKKKTCIRIPAQPHELLDWQKQKEEALKAIESGRQIVWEFDLGLNAPYFPLEDELRYQSLSLAMSGFTNEIWPQFQEKTAGAILFRGSADFSHFFQWSEKQEANWNIWKEGRLSEEGHLRRLFCAEAFAAYFQMLAHKLPDELPLTLELDVRPIGTLAQTYHLLSPERFEHFLLEIEGLPETAKEANIGICFPQDALCSQDVLNRLDLLFASLKIPHRVVYESTLSEQWEGLDTLYVFPDSLSVQGKRKLMGFSAAGGLVIDRLSIK